MRGKKRRFNETLDSYQSRMLIHLKNLFSSGSNMTLDKTRLAIAARLIAIKINEDILSIRDNNVRAVVGVEKNSTILTELIADELEVPAMIMRNTDTAASIWRLAPGYAKREKGGLIIVDDVLTTGKTLRSVIASLKRAQYRVLGVYVFIDLRNSQGVLGNKIRAVLKASRRILINSKAGKHDHPKCPAQAVEFTPTVRSD